MNSGRKYRVTASMFHAVLANPDTKKYQAYLDDLVYRLKGNPDFEDDPPWFWHGKEWEAEALDCYEWEKDVTIERQVFVIHPKYDFISCTVDGVVIGHKGGVENKARKSLTEHLKSKKAGIDSKHIPQVQGTLWITGYDWWDFQSHYKLVKNGETIATDNHIYRVYPDENYFKKLETACLNFWDKVQDGLKQHRGVGDGRS